MHELEACQSLAGWPMAGFTVVQVAKVSGQLRNWPNPSPVDEVECLHSFPFIEAKVSMISRIAAAK